MSYTAKQHRAIAWVVKRYRLRLTLSAWPNIRAQKPDGSIFQEAISDIVAWYDADRERVKRAQREEAAAARRATRGQR